ncbi:hypothetical protein MLD38_019856 [Melastoma candidum]|uniref:Uncharacterized protein n=1 Tax=Melastoma candidum TaxID=119954 RepID=A0ACB9QE27_9MYRT|nr:hypothetical protein MLD38_019856 [Melastoma candidum]
MVGTTSFCCSRLIIPIDASSIPQPSAPKFHAFRCHSYDLGLFGSRRFRLSIAPVWSKSSSEAEPTEPGAAEADEWLEKLPEKNRPLYAHSLFCIEAWLKSLGFRQSKEDRAVWHIELPEWHAQLSLDIADLYIRYLKSGPGNLKKDVERRFSYALSREDIENAILGGP